MVNNGMASANGMYSSLYAYFQLGKGVYGTVSGSQVIDSLCHTVGKACLTQWVV